jgi:hypothetical protein
MSLVITAFWLVYFLTKKDLVQSIIFTNMEIVIEAETRIPGYLRRNPILHSL